MARKTNNEEPTTTPTPEPVPLAMQTQTGERWDPAEVAEQQMARLREIKLLRDEGDKGHVGEWYGEPFQRHPELRGWYFYRCGLRGNERAEAIAWQYRQYGWTEAPRGVRMRGFERDGDNMLVMCARPEVHANMTADQRRRLSHTARPSADKAALDELNALTDGNVEHSVIEGKGSVAEFKQAQAQAFRGTV